MDKASHITERQNEPRELLRMKAQRRLHARAFVLSSVTTICALVVAVAGPAIASGNPTLEPWVALVGIVFAATEVIVLRPLEETLRKKGASIQELFDCYVLDLPWNSLAVEEQPTHEDVVGSAGVGGTPTDESLRDWYSPALVAVPDNVARVICQRSNAWWDSEQRRPYAMALMAVAVVVPVALVAWTLGRGGSLSDYVVVLAAALPLVQWAAQEARSHHDAADRASRLRTFADDLWKRVLDARERHHASQSESRILQDQLFAHRWLSPNVPDWFYKTSRRKREHQMSAGTEQLIREYVRSKETAVIKPPHDDLVTPAAEDRLSPLV